MGAGASSQVKSIEEDVHVTNDLSSSKTKSVKIKKEASKKVRSTPNNDDTTSVKSSPPTGTKVKKMNPAPSASSPVPSSSTSSTSKSQQSVSASSDLKLKVGELEKELAEKDSERLDHLDQIQALEEHVQELTSALAASKSSGDGDIGETLKAKDLYIRQMEQQQETEQAEAKKVRIRLKKKIRNLTAQLSEAKQESSIAQLEFKDRNEQLQNELHNSKGDGRILGATSQDEKEDDKESKMQIILDLSAEVSDQAEKISSLQQLLKERDREIEQLKDTVKQVSKAAQLNKRAADSSSQQNDRDPRSGPRRGDGLTGASQHQQNNGQFTNSGRSTSNFTPVESAAGGYGSEAHSRQRGLRPHSKIGPRPTNTQEASSEFSLQRQSTALSDSDSDWEMDEDPNKIRSAPARMRIRSAATIPEEKDPDGSDLDNKWNLVTDDNDLLLSSQARPTFGNSNRNKRKSALKTKLEHDRNERAKGLLGPSLAFAQPAGDQLTDTSCNNTPSATPRVNAVHFPSALKTC